MLLANLCGNLGGRTAVADIKWLKTSRQDDHETVGEGGCAFRQVPEGGCDCSGPGVTCVACLAYLFLPGKNRGTGRVNDF